MGRENRFQTLQTRLNKQAKFMQIAIFFLIKTRPYKIQITKQSCFKNLAKYSQNYPYQAQIQSFQPTSCSKIHNQNSCFITQIIKEQIKLQFLVNKSIFGTRLIVFVTFHRWPRQSSILPALTIALGNYHQFHHTKPLLKI